MRRPIYYHKRGVFGQHNKYIISFLESLIARIDCVYAVYKWQHGQEYWFHNGKWIKE